VQNPVGEVDVQVETELMEKVAELMETIKRMQMARMNVLDIYI